MQQVEQLELQEEAAGAMITVKKRKGKTTGQQTKLTSCTGVSGSSLKVTRPSPFAETIEPTVAEPKKGSSGRGRGASRKHSQKTLEAFLESSDDDIPVLMKAVSKPKAQPAAKPAAKSTKVISSSDVDVNLSVNW